VGLLACVEKSPVPKPCCSAACTLFFLVCCWLLLVLMPYYQVSSACNCHALSHQQPGHCPDLELWSAFCTFCTECLAISKSQARSGLICLIYVCGQMKQWLVSWRLHHITLLCSGRQLQSSTYKNASFGRANCRRGSM